MKIVLAFDSFKGCISATEACQAAAEALHAAHPDIETVTLPMSDGGEGLVQAVQNYHQRMGNQPLPCIHIQAHGPLMEPLTAQYLLSRDGKTAYMEMAATSGLPLVPIEKRNPLITTTYGVGEMLLDAVSRGVEHIIMGIGGSATNDGGMGMIQALRDAGIELPTRLSSSSDQPKKPSSNTPLTWPDITVACDVTNPLCGPRGASAIFGPQKGATPEMIPLLDARLRESAQRAIAEGKATPAMMESPGAGAAGGLGFGLMAYLGAQLKSGIDILLDIVGFDAEIQDADLVITGEGKSDPQTLMGKVPHGILRRCQRLGLPVCLLSGAIDDPDGSLHRAFSHVASINADDPRPLATLLSPDVALENMKKATTTICNHLL